MTPGNPICPAPAALGVSPEPDAPGGGSPEDGGAGEDDRWQRWAKAARDGTVTTPTPSELVGAQTGDGDHRCCLHPHSSVTEGVCCVCDAGDPCDANAETDAGDPPASPGTAERGGR